MIGTEYQMTINLETTGGKRSSSFLSFSERQANKAEACLPGWAGNTEFPTLL